MPVESMREPAQVNREGLGSVRTDLEQWAIEQPGGSQVQFPGEDQRAVAAIAGHLLHL